MFYCFHGQIFDHCKTELVILPELQPSILEIQIPTVNLIFLFRSIIMKITLFFLVKSILKIIFGREHKKLNMIVLYPGFFNVVNLPYYSFIQLRM